MAMGYRANMVLTITRETLENIVPTQYAAFKKWEDALDNQLDWHEHSVMALLNRPLATFHVADIAEYVASDIEEDHADILPFVQAYKNLLWTFKIQTGLSLYLGYHGEEEGDQYDDVDLVYFKLDASEIYQERPEVVAARKIGLDFQDSYFVTYE